MLFNKDSEGFTKKQEQSVKPLKSTHSVAYNQELTKNMNSNYYIDRGVDLQTLNNYGRLPKKKVWIYNVSSISHPVTHPLIRITEIPAKEDGKDYAVVLSLPEVMALPRDSVDSGELLFILEDGRRIAQDFINPSNLSLDQNSNLFGKTNNQSVNRNLNDSGVFWSMHNPPLKSELKAANKRMERHYEVLNKRTMIKAMMNPLELRGLSPEDREAYRYMQDKVMTQENTQNVRK